MVAARREARRGTAWPWYHENSIWDIGTLIQLQRELRLTSKNDPDFKTWKCSLIPCIAAGTNNEGDDFDIIVQFYMAMGHELGKNTRIEKLILNPFVAVSDRKAQCMLAKGIRLSKIHSLTIRCSNQPQARVFDPFHQSILYRTVSQHIDRQQVLDIVRTLCGRVGRRSNDHIVRGTLL